MAYGKKQWSMDKLCSVLFDHSKALGINWGWKRDDNAGGFHDWVLYVDLPTGQVSYHTSARGMGPDYSGEWDGVRGESNERLIKWVDTIVSPRCEICNQEIGEDGFYCCERCARRFGPCCNSVDDTTCVECADGC
jgi:hypothetical protein